jgi:hypothetical protein
MSHGKCHRGDACPYRHDNLPSPQQQQQAAAVSNNNSTKPPQRKRPKLTLLEKLLTNEVARETTLTLQLLEYIAKSNFYKTATTNQEAMVKKWPQVLTMTRLQLQIRRRRYRWLRVCFCCGHVFCGKIGSDDF